MGAMPLPLAVVMPDEPVSLDVDALYGQFARLPDQRHRRGIRYSLPRLLTIAVLAKLAGADTVEAIADWAHLRATELNGLFGRQNSPMPHVVSWQRIFQSAVAPAAFTQAVATVLAPPCAEVPERGSILLTMDGKTMRGTIPAGSTRGEHLLAAYQPDAGGA